MTEAERSALAEYILVDQGYHLDCWSPLEISDPASGAYVTGQFAESLLADLIDEWNAESREPVKRTDGECVYLGDEQSGKLADNGHQLYDCLYHGECTTEGEAVLRASCASCKEKLIDDDPKFAKSFQDNLLVFDREMRRTEALRDMLKGGPAFLVCGGPSAKELPLDRLSERGPWSLAINNAANQLKASTVN